MGIFGFIRRALVSLQSRRASGHGPRRARLQLEGLEDRLVPSTLVVGTGGPPGSRHFASFQQAYRLALPGDVIQIEPGAVFGEAPQGVIGKWVSGGGTGSLDHMTIAGTTIGVDEVVSVNQGNASDVRLHLLTRVVNNGNGTETVYFDQPLQQPFTGSTVYVEAVGALGIGKDITVQGDPSSPNYLKLPLTHHFDVMPISGVVLQYLNLRSPLTLLAGAQNTTVQNSFLSGLSEVGDPFSDYNGNTLQGNTISGSVSLAAQHPWQFPTEVVGNTFVGLGRLDIASLSTDPTFVDVHGNTFTGGGSHYVAIRVEMGDRDVSIHDNTMNLQPGAFTVGIYVTDSQFVHIDNNHIKLAGDSTSIGIMIESYSFDPNVVFPCDVSITNNSQIDTGGKGTGLQFYLHKQDTTDTQPFLQAFVQQNNFNHNAIGVGVEGYGPEAGHIDLGGGALGSSGGNDFSGFTDADTANGHFAIALHNTVAGYILWANNNLFNLAWDPGVLKDSINNTDATEADYYSATEVGTGVIDIGTPPPNNSGGGTGGGDGSGGGGSYDPNGYGGYVNRKPAAQ